MNTIKIFLLSVSIALSINSYGQSDIYFPERNSSWETRSPQNFKIDKKQLSDAVQFAVENEYSGSKDLRIAILKGFAREPFHEILGPTKKRGGPAGLVLKKGFIIASWGDTKRVDMTFSVTKSFLSTVAGLAVDRQLIRSTDDLVAEYIWDGTFEGPHNSKISWKNLLHQNSDWSGELWGIKDWADRPPREGTLDDWKYRELKAPGTVMEYNDVRVNVLAYALTHLWRDPLPKVLKEQLMDPIGASTTWRWFGYDHAWTVVDGVKIKSVTGGGHSGAGIFINAEDMARFGLLFMNNGTWNNQNIISKEWIEEAVTSSPSHVNYGHMWWLNKKGEDQWEGSPETIFSAQGFGGNYIVIDREREIVVVTRWMEPGKMAEFLKKLYEAMN
ncbi:MAG: serine hydrolase domain-containing protein [Flavobacteriaceae bacterium]